MAADGAECGTTRPDEGCETMRTEFDAAVAAILSQKREDNNAFLDAAEYDRRLRHVRRAKLAVAGAANSAADRRVLRKYDVAEVDGRDRLVRPDTGLRYVTTEELFDVLHRAHRDIGHGGRNRMSAAIKAHYCNVTKEAVMTYLRLCARCAAAKTAAVAGSQQQQQQQPQTQTQPKQPSPPAASAIYAEAPPGAARDSAGAASRPEWPASRGVSRARIELIDMHAQAYEGFRYVMKHCYCATRFVHLIALQSVRPDEVARRLLDVYATFGVPAVVESQCGVEFVASVIGHIRSAWNCRVNIECVEPDAQEAASGRATVGRMLDTWTANRNCDNWPLGLKFVQLQKNCELHPAIGMTPYQAMFGYPPSSDWLSSDFASGVSDAAGARAASEDDGGETAHQQPPDEETIDPSSPSDTKIKYDDDTPDRTD